MEDLKLEIIITQLPSGKFKLITDFPEGANVALICSHLDNVSNGLKTMVSEKVNEFEFPDADQALEYANGLKIEDLL